jgi:hypothetical protein
VFYSFPILKRKAEHVVGRIPARSDISGHDLNCQLQILKTLLPRWQEEGCRIHHGVCEFAKLETSLIK